MADDTVSPEIEWQKIRRLGNSLPRLAPTITVRRSGDLALSADFVRVAGISECTRVGLFVSTDGLRLALHFHSDESDDDAFLLCPDGGSGFRNRSPGRVVQAHAIRQQSPALAALTKESVAARRLLPKRGLGGRWIVNLSPCFELTFGGTAELLPTATGIYRYRLGPDTVYIGRGSLKVRFSSPDRREWGFDRIEYSILNDDAGERRWEAYWLDEYRRRSNRLPLYNRIAAASASPSIRAG